MRRVVALIGLLAILAVGLTACNTANGPGVRQQAAQATADRAATFAKASAQIPTPKITNFPRRQTLVDSTIRQSLPHHPWYVYVLGQNGNIVNYFVAKSVPVNDCDYLSSTQTVTDHYDSTVVLDAPSLEGIYQSSSGCNTLTFFDLTTNAEIQVSSLQTFVTDRPLKVAAAPIRVSH